MIIGCLLPLLLIFIAPSLGLGGNIPLFIFILAMFACHLLMPMHGGHSHQRDNAGPRTKIIKPNRNHERHQH